MCRGSDLNPPHNGDITQSPPHFLRGRSSNTFFRMGFILYVLYVTVNKEREVESLSDSRKKITEIDILSLVKVYQATVAESANLAIDARKKLAEFMKACYEVIENVKQRLPTIVAQYKRALSEGFDNFDPPETYDPIRVQLHPWTLELALSEGYRLLDDLGNSKFAFMLDRYRKGFNAYLSQEYQLSTFTFISMVDGMIKRFCEMHRNDDCQYTGVYPTFEKGLQHLRKHYKFEIFVGTGKFEKKLRAFFKHRNEIMHGGEHSFFDENVSTIALLFLAVVFASIS